MSQEQQEQTTTTQSARLFVGNLAWVTRWQALKDVFKEIGPVRHADVLIDRSGRSKGCGIIEFESVEDAQRAIAELQDREIDGRKIFVREDREAGRAPAAAAEGGPRDAYAAFGGRQRQQQQGGGGYGAGGAGAGAGGYGRQPRQGGFQPRGQSPQPAQGGSDSPNAGKQLFVMGVPYDAEIKELNELFQPCGQIVRSEIKVDSRTGRSKGLATILFATTAEAQDAITSFDGTEFRGRKLAVKLDRFPQ